MIRWRRQPIRLDPEGVEDPLAEFRPVLEPAGRWLMAAGLLFLIAFAGGVVLVGLLGEHRGARDVDFAAFWGAARLALEGRAAAAFDQEALRAAQGLAPEAGPVSFYWLYPPGLQLLMMPLGLLPFWAAWLVFVTLSIGAFAAALWRFAAPVTLARTLLFASPAVILAFTLGQLALLWTAGAVASFVAVARGRPALAGVLLALLTLKPQLGLLIPFALLARGRWDVVAWTLAGMVLVHGLPTLVLGADYWSAFAEQLGRSWARLAGDGLPRALMVSPYALMRLAGLGHGPAQGLQWMVTAALALAIARLWWPRRPRDDLPLGALLVASPAASPYAYHYEFTLVVAGAIFLLRGGYGRAMLDRLLLVAAVPGLALVWAGPLAPLFAIIPPAILARVLAGDSEDRRRHPRR